MWPEIFTRFEKAQKVQSNVKSDLKKSVAKNSCLLNQSSSFGGVKENDLHRASTSDRTINAGPT